MSLFNYITFTETATTKVEKLFKKQEQEHVQNLEQQEQVKIQVQTKQIAQMNTKIKKHKKHKQQEQEVSETTIQCEQKETLAHETSAELPQSETLEQIEESLSTYETLPIQNLSKDTLQTVAVSVTTELSTPSPTASRVQEEILPQKVLAINEEVLPLDEFGLRKESPRPKENKLTENIEVRLKHALNVSHAKTAESSKELPSKIPKSVKAQRKMKESRSLVVEAPNAEEAIEDLKPLKAVSQEVQSDILFSHEITEEQHQALETIEKLKPTSAIEDTVQQKLLSQEELIIAEVLPSETVGRDVTDVRPPGETISPRLTPNMSLCITECQPEDSIGEMQQAAKERMETPSMSVTESKAVGGQELEVLENVDHMPLITQPTKGLADYTIKAEEVPVQVQEIITFDSLERETVAKTQTAKSNALELFELSEGLVSSTADSHSPIAEDLPIFEKDVKEATIDMQMQHHVTTSETVSNENAVKDLKAVDTPKMAEGTLGQSSALTIGETQQMNLVETTVELIEPNVESTKPAKGALTEAYGTAESNEETLLESLGLVPDDNRKIEQGKVNISEGEYVAKVQTTTVTDTEGEFVSVAPKLVNPKFDFVEQSALQIKQDTTVEKEEILSSNIELAPQLATSNMFPAELKVTSIYEVQPGLTSSDIITEQTKSVSANQVFETMSIGVTSKPDMLESTSHIDAFQHPEFKTGDTILDENQQPLEVTNVQITESSTDIIDVLPNQKLTKAETVTDGFKYAEGLVVLPMESTIDKTEDTKPTAVNADISMHQQFGTDVREQEPLESTLTRTEDLKPQTQTTESQFGLLQSLETSSCVTLEGESVLSVKERHPEQSAAIGTSSALQVANITRPQHMESLDRLDEQKVPYYQANVNIGEITLPNVEKIDSFDVLSDLNTPDYNKSSKGRVQLIESTTSLKTTTAVVSESTEELKDLNITQPVHIKPKPYESDQKISISEQTNVLEHVSSLNPVLPALETIQSSIKSLHEINVRETDILEKEESLKDVDHISGRLAKIILDCTTGIAQVRQEETLEHEEDLKAPLIPLEKAIPASSELHRLPLTEYVQEQQGTSDMTDFKVSNKCASPNIDHLYETKSSEMIVYDSSINSVDSEFPAGIVPQKSLVPFRHTMVTENVAFNASENFEILSADQQIATNVQDSLSQSIIAEDQIAFETEQNLGLETTPTQKPKLLKDDRNLHAKLVDEATVYEAMGQEQKVDKYNIQQAEITHDLPQVYATDLQQTFEAEKEITTREQSYVAATTDIIPSRLGLAMTTKTHPVEGIDVLLSSPPKPSLAQTNYEETQHEVRVRETQAIEESEELTDGRLLPVSAVESIDSTFKVTSDSQQPPVFDKELSIPTVSPLEARAKPSLNLLQGTTTFDVIPLESSVLLKDTHVAVQKAQQEYVAQVESNKVHVQMDNLVMHKEDIFENAEIENFCKPITEGTQLETVVIEVVPIDNVGGIHLAPQPSTLLATLTSTDIVNQSHVIDTQVPLEMESEAQAPLDNIAQARIKSAEAHVHTNVSEVNVYEQTKAIQDQNKHGLFVKVSKNSDTSKAYLTTIQSTFLKEDILPKPNILQDTAQAAADELQSLVTEEVVSVSSIQETYELKIPLQKTANLTQQTPQNSVNVCQQLAYEETPDIAFEPHALTRATTSSVPTFLKPAENATVNIYENIEGHGDFKPGTVNLTSNSNLNSELVVSVVQEVTSVPSLGSLATVEPQELKAMPVTKSSTNLAYSEEGGIPYVQITVEEAKLVNTRADVEENITSVTTEQPNMCIAASIQLPAIEEKKLENALQTPQFASESILKTSPQISRNAHFETRTHEEEYSTTTESLVTTQALRDDIDSTQKNVMQDVQMYKHFATKSLDKTVKVETGKYIVRLYLVS